MSIIMEAKGRMSQKDFSMRKQVEIKRQHFKKDPLIEK